MFATDSKSKTFMRASALLFGFALSAAAQPPDLANQVKTVHLTRVAKPPKLDDFLSGNIPPGQARIDDFRQNAPSDGDKATRETVAYLSYDDQHLYAVFLCKEEKSKIRARMANRDDIDSDDQVALYLDTFRDRQHVLDFYVNPLGIQADATSTEGQADDYSYDTLWRSDGRLTPDGYAVWIAIPFRSLRFSSADVQTWGIGLARFIPAINESSYWPYYTSRISGFAPQLGSTEGLERVSAGRNLEVIPYVFGERAQYLNTPSYTAPDFKSQTPLRAGADIKAIIHDSFTLDVTVNPDFSQVESEDPQITINQRFEVYFPELRPFFLENAAYFMTPDNLFFSRTIQDPEIGARLTGRSGPWQVGFLAMDDRYPGNTLPSSSPNYGQHAADGVVRVQRDLGEESNVGLMATAYDFGAHHEYLGSADARIRFSDNLVLTGQAVHSETSIPGLPHVSGSDYLAALEYSGLHFEETTHYLDRSPNFQTMLGFIPRVNIRQVDQDLAYHFLPAGDLIKAWGPTMELIEDWDHTEKIQDRIITPGMAFELTGQTFITAQNTQSIEVYQNIAFRKHLTDFSVNSDFSKHFGVQSDFNFGRLVNYYPAAGLQPFSANGQNATFKFIVRPSPKLRYEQTYLLSRLQSLNGGPVIFDDHILRSTLRYQFTKRFSLRIIGEYDAVLPNSGLVNLTKSKIFTSNVLLTYLLSPGTALYAGYTDQRQNLALMQAMSQGMPLSLATIGDPSTLTDREIFIKLSYAFHF
jgi:Domain of unknown function (DUF5916)